MYLFLIIVFFIFTHFLIATPENFRTSLILLSFILIASIIIKNSEHNKQLLLLNVIKYCCIINCFYGVFFNQVFIGSRVGGLDQAPVLFGYNMLLGFWVTMFSTKTNFSSKKIYSRLDIIYASLFVIAIFLSQSRGAIFGLASGMTYVFLKSSKINKNILVFLILVFFIIVITYLYNPIFYFDRFGLGRILDIFTGDAEEERFVIWKGMITVYIEQFNIFKALFGGGQGSATDLIKRGVHSDHLKLIFDYGILGYFIYLIIIFKCFNLIRYFNIFLGGFLVSTLTSGFFYTNIGSITNSTSYYLVLIILFNFIRPSIKNNFSRNYK